jgi:hypothetical protein
MKKNKLTNLDWILLFACLLVLIGALIFLAYYVTEKTDSCTSDPFGYGVKTLKEKFDVDVVYGNVYLYKGGKNTIMDSFGDVNFTYSINQ